jgi:transcriptional regulator with XRE-family HTH domain
MLNILRVKELCKEKGITIAEIASKIGVSPSALSQNLSGNPSLERLVEIADVLDVPIQKLFERPSTDAIMCPYCGGKIRVSKE